MKLRNAFLAAGLMALPLAAEAQPVTGPYVSLGLGGDYLQSEIFKDKAGSGTNGKASFDNPGFAGQISGGYGFGNGLRAELELDAMTNSVDHLSVGGVQAPGQSGSQATYGLMANVLYDFDFGLPVFPYVGLGVGYQMANVGMRASAAGTNVLSLNGTAGSVAGQGIIGLALPISSVPGLSVTGEYRILDAFGSLSDYKATSPLVTGSAKTSMNRVLSQMVLVGLRYAFNAAPPPPPPAPAPAPVAAPAPAPARTYLVFFDWDRADLTDRARQIISEAAQASTRVQYTRIEVNGYTDRSGTAKYNQALSVRRAKAVEAELVRDGVPQNAIAIQGFGEEHPLVPTANGVREPQNRRVEIILK